MPGVKTSAGGAARIAASALAALLISAAGEGRAQPAATPPVTYAVQGWSDADRDTFYTTSQGSHMMPAAWFLALRRLDVDEPFAGD